VGGVRSGKVLSEGERALVRKLAAEGVSVQDIARQLARSSGPVQAVVRGDYDPRRVSESDRTQMAALAAEGLTLRQIGARLGWATTSVHRALTASGDRGPVGSWDPSPARLSLSEREEIRVGVADGKTFRAIAASLGRATSTVSREVKANGGRTQYRARMAHGRARDQARRPKTAKLVACPRLADQVREWLADLWSPAQISARLRTDFGDDPHMRVSHETIYQSLYVQGRGALRKELAACLRTGRAVRRPQHRLERRGQIPGKVMISERPAEVADRAVPGHWEGDLIIGAHNRSAVGTLVERSSRFVLLLHLADTRAETVNQAMKDAIATLPGELFRSITWDQGREMAHHATFTIDTGIQIYFCDPHSPWQRGSNENTNGLLRQYMPKSTDLSVHTPADLTGFARSMNNRPRKTLGWLNPSEKLTQLIALTP
jgi:IS30 family transposase